MLLDKREPLPFFGVSTVLRSHLGESGNSAQQKSIETDSYTFINWVLFLETCPNLCCCEKISILQFYA